MIQLAQYEAFLKSVTEELEGDWVIIGGSMLALVRAEARLTADIDLCPINELTNDLRLSLMTIATKSGLSIESINPAADYFLRQIPNWKSSIVLLQQGKKGALYRPSLELYFKLKCERLSQTDIHDCESFLNWHKKQNITFDKDSLKKYLNLKIVSVSNVESQKKLTHLLDQL